MKQILLASYVLASLTVIGQRDHPFYEQLALDYYNNEILQEHPLAKRITVDRYTINIRPPEFVLSTPNCLDEIEWQSNHQFVPIRSYAESLNKFDSNRHQLDVSKLNRKQFRIRQNGQGRFPKLYISLPHIEFEDKKRIFINVYEQHDRQMTVVYHLELDVEERIVDWCRIERNIMILH